MFSSIAEIIVIPNAVNRLPTQVTNCLFLHAMLPTSLPSTLGRFETKFRKHLDLSSHPNPKPPKDHRPPNPKNSRPVLK